jgi:glycosyltransferase involved in cell wall biosynthesis
MRIGIDARLNAYRVGGIPHYTQQLLAALAPLASNDTLLVLQHYRHTRPLLAAPNVRRARLFTPPHHRLEAWALPAEVLPLRLDVLHLPDFIAPRRRPCPAVVTIHDLAFLHFPGILDASAERYYRQVRASVWHADAVIAVSHATRADISTLLELPPERIDVVYEAAAPCFVPLALDAAAARRFTPGPPAGGPGTPGTPQWLQAGSFALFVSTLEPRKNLTTLLQAVRICCDRRPDVPYCLVVAGARGWHDAPIFECVRDLRLGNVVLFIGSVTQEALLWLYNACRLYLNPSRYEGFGLPVLEAMACGAPALVSTAGSLPEVAGDAALLLPPLDVQAWADALEHTWNDQDTREALASRAVAQAARFSWQRTAQETLTIYRRVARRG